MRLRKRLITEVLPYLQYLQKKGDVESSTDTIKVIASLTEYAILTNNQKKIFRTLLKSEKSLTTMDVLTLLEKHLRVAPFQIGRWLDDMYKKSDLVICESRIGKKTTWSVKRPEDFAWNEKYQKV